MNPTDPDTCPRCGEKLVPVLDAGAHSAARDGRAPLLADSPVRLACTVCPRTEAPSSTSR
ncbi:hypothetical protein [Nocardioides rubriscoriae]|uniref:hypothetical protein n=1 Tax=Nocardioides rubriscoriae TaxID=642762 RepID=UPI0011DF3A9E|nr:hypothetical protein [Nocardioides rubriscoriae]